MTGDTNVVDSPELITERLRLRRWTDNDTEADYGPSGSAVARWAIEILGSGRLIGAVWLAPIPFGGTDFEIGWHISPAGWGHGYGAEASHAVAHHALSARRPAPFTRRNATRAPERRLRVGSHAVAGTETPEARPLHLCGLHVAGPHPRESSAGVSSY